MQSSISEQDSVQYSEDITAQWEYVYNEQTSAAQDETTPDNDTVASLEGLPVIEDQVIEVTTIETQINEQQELAQEEITDEAQVMEVNFSESKPVILETPEKLAFNFANNKYDIAQADYEHLNKHAEHLKGNPILVLNINGYTDNRGSTEYNVKLSIKRAEQIHGILVTLGAPESQLKINGYGETFPVNDEKNWDENRRVELVYEQLDDSLMLSSN